MNKNLIKSLVIGIISLSLATSCAQFKVFQKEETKKCSTSKCCKKKCSTKKGKTGKCSAKKDKASKCSAKKGKTSKCSSKNKKCSSKTK